MTEPYEATYAGQTVLVHSEYTVRGIPARLIELPDGTMRDIVLITPTEAVDPAVLERILTEPNALINVGEMSEAEFDRFMADHTVDVAELSPEQLRARMFTKPKLLAQSGFRSSDTMDAPLFNLAIEEPDC